MLAVISFLSFSLVGVGVVLPSWIAFHIGGSKLVGLVLLASSLTGLLLAPFIGHIVDRHDRRQVAMAGQTIRTCGLMLIAPVQFADQVVGTVLLIVASVMGALGYALHDGALSGLLQVAVAQKDRIAFVMKLSVARQIGLAAGTGFAGFAIARFGSTTSALCFAAMAGACIFLVRAIDAADSGTRWLPVSGVMDSSRKALAYLIANPACLVASATVGVSFAVIKVTNLLLPGFVVRALNGDSGLFGTLEMVAAICGTAAVAIVSLPGFIARIERHTLVLLAAAGLSLVAFSFVRTPVTAVIVYGCAGMVWSVTRSAANGQLLKVVDTAVVGRVQAFTTLLTGVFGTVIFLMPLAATHAAESMLYLVCGVAVLAVAFALGALSRRL